MTDTTPADTAPVNTTPVNTTSTSAIDTSLLNTVVAACRVAGEAILAVYERSEGFEVDHKADDSPLTEADLAAHHVLVDVLEGLLDGVPVLSEESSLPPYSERSQWQRYWIIDPLDGTKEFVKRSGEFTVNVALVDNGVPVLGVVHVPVLGVTYTGLQVGGDAGAYKHTTAGMQPIASRPMQGRGSVAEPVIVVASRSHGAGAVADLMQQVSQRLGQVNTNNMGSSLKLCLVAEGAADIYPRLAPTCEWDTAAAQAVVEAAGGRVVDTNHRTLRYNQKDEILNPYFLVLGDSGFDWKGTLGSFQA